MSRITISSEERLRQAHAELLADLQLLSSGTSGLGLPALRTSLLKARQDLKNHFGLEEENGYLDEVRKREPCLEQTLTKLVGEHSKLLKQLDDILARLEYPQPEINELQRQVRLWIHDVRGHELRENDLIQDAFVHDLGSGD